MSGDVGFKLGLDLSSFKAGIDHASNLTSRFNSLLGTIGLGVTAAGVISFFKGVVDHAGKVQDLSERLGVSNQAIQALEYHAKLAGGSMDQVAGVFDKTRKSLDGLMEGQKISEDQFAKLGLSAKNFVGLNLEQALAVIARAYKDSAGEAGSYDAVTDIMGTKTMPKLNAVLLQYGAEGAQTFIDKTREMGVIADEETGKKLDELGDRFTLVSARATKSGKELLVFLDTWNEKAGNFIKSIANAVGIDGGPFKKVEVETKKVQENVVATIPVIDKLTEREKERLKVQLEQTKEGREAMLRSERLAVLKEDEINIERAMAQEGISKSVQEALNLTLAETKKQIKTEEKALNAEEAKHAQRMQEMTAKEIEDTREQLTFSQQFQKLREDEAGWVAVMTDQEVSAEVRRNAEFELAKVRAKMRDVEMDKKKEEYELATLLLIPAEQLTESDKLRLQVLQGSVTQKELDEEQTRLIAGLNAGTLTPAEKDRLRVLMDQQAVLATQLETARAITVAVSRTGKGYDAQSDDSLEGVRARLKSQIDQIKRNDFGVAGGVGGKGKPAELYLLESELFNLEKEYNQRQEVRDYASRFGEQKARQQFGDTLTDKALRDWTNKQDVANSALIDIQTRLKALFPTT